VRAITRSVREAVSVDYPIPGSSEQGLRVHKADPATETTTFFVSGGTLYVSEGLSTAVALTNDKVRVENFTFDNVARAGTPDSIRVRLTLSQLSESGLVGGYSADFYGAATIR